MNAVVLTCTGKIEFYAFFLLEMRKPAKRNINRKAMHAKIKQMMFAFAFRLKTHEIYEYELSHRQHTHNMPSTI